MTKTEAQQATKLGKRITHSLFSPGEYLHATADGKLWLNSYPFDLGFSRLTGPEWETGWMIFYHQQ